MKTINSIICILTFVIAQGCTSPGAYGRFYQGEISERFPPSKHVQVYKYDESALLSLKGDGYMVIGQSNFRGPFSDQRNAVAQGKRVGADIVLVEYNQVGMAQGVLPVIEYHDAQTTTISSRGTVNGTAYGPAGVIYGDATSRTTSVVTSPAYTSTNYVPYTYQIYDHTAVYLRKIEAAPQRLNDANVYSSALIDPSANTLGDQFKLQLKPTLGE